MRIRQSTRPDALNVGSRTDTGGQMGPVQNSADGNVVESPQTGEIQQQAPLLKKEIVQNSRMSPFREITP